MVIDRLLLDNDVSVHVQGTSNRCRKACRAGTFSELPWPAPPAQPDRASSATVAPEAPFRVAASGAAMLRLFSSVMAPPKPEQDAVCGRAAGASLQEPLRAFADPILRALDYAGGIVAVIGVKSAPADRPDFHVIAANDAFSRIFGKDGNHLIRQRPASLWNRGQGAAREARIAAVEFTGESIIEEVVCETPEGQHRWIELRVMPERTQAGQPCLVLIGRDVTTSRGRPSNDDASRILLASAFVHTAAAVAIFRADGRFVTANPCFLSLCGSSLSSISHLSFDDLLDSDDHLPVFAGDTQSVQNPAPFECRVRLLRSEQEALPAVAHMELTGQPNLQRFYVVTLTPIPDDPGIGSVKVATTPSAGNEREAGSVVVAGNLQLIGLNEIKQSLGERWPAMAEKAMLTAEHVLRRRLLPQENFSRTCDHGFVVCFHGDDKEEIAFRAAMLAREIRRKLIGDDAESPHMAVTALTDTQPLPPADQALPPVALARKLEQRVAAQRARAEAEARNVLQDVISSPGCSLERVMTTDCMPVPLLIGDLPELTRRRVATALGVLPPSETVGFNIDILCLAVLAEALLTPAGGTEVSACLVPLEFDAFAKRGGAEKVVEQLRALGPAILRQAVPLLGQVPGDASPMRVEYALRLLRSAAKAVAIEVGDFEDLPFNPEARLVSFIVSDARPLMRQIKRRERSLLSHARRLRAHGIRLLARGIASQADAASLKNAGIDLVSFS
jgi:PAS domain S-box-containing protein